MNFSVTKLIALIVFSMVPALCVGQELALTPPPPPVLEQPNLEQIAETTITTSATPENAVRISEEALETVIPEVTPQNTLSHELNTSNGVNIGLSPEIRQKVATILNKLLADEYVLYTKTLKFHWNVTGIVFHDFHAAFKEQYETLFTIVDDIAERARALGAPALGSLQEFSLHTRLKEITTEKLTALEMVKQLLADHESIIRQLRADTALVDSLGDQVTSNFLQEITTKHEKIAWMLRATAAQ